MSRSLILSLLVLLALSSVLGGCGRREGGPGALDTEARELPRKGGTLRVPVAPGRVSLDPLQGKHPFQIDLWRSLYPSLVTLAPRGPRPPEARADFARDWGWSPDTRTLTMVLRPGRVWADTIPMTPHDVVATYQAYLRNQLLPAWVSGPPGRAERRAGSAPVPRPALTGSPALTAVEALDDSTVRFLFRDGVPLWSALEMASYPILPSHRLAARTGGVASGDWGGGEPLVSGGAFRLPPSAPGRALTLRANPLAPFGHDPFVRRVVLDPCPGADARILRLLLGRADLVTDAPVASLHEWLPPASEVRTHQAGVLSVEMLFWNLRDPRFPPSLREAVSLAIDRDQLLSLLLTWRGRRYGGVASGLLEPSGPDSAIMAALEERAASVRDTIPLAPRPNPALSLATLLQESPPPRHDPAAARRILEKAGYRDRDGDGLRGRPEYEVRSTFLPGDSVAFITPLEVPVRIRMLYDRSNELRESIAASLEEDLFRVGIVLEPVAREGTEVFERFMAGEFETALLGFRPPESPDLSGLWASWGRWNGGGYSSTVVDSLMQLQLSSEEEAEVEAFSREIEAHVRRDFPVTFLVYRERVDLLSPRLRGYAARASEPLGNLERIWLADTTEAGTLNPDLLAPGELFRPLPEVAAQ